MTWYCISLPFAILLLWLIYQTFFMFLISKVMKKNRNEDPTVSLPSGQNRGNTHSGAVHKEGDMKSSFLGVKI